MRVLMLSTDANMLDRNSAVFTRTYAYAREFGELDVILCMTGRAEKIVEGPLRIRPTNSLSKVLCGLSAIATARAIGPIDVVTAQDPFEIGIAAYIIASARGSRLHLQVHTDLFSPEYHRFSILNRIRVTIARFLLRRADGIRVVSERIKRDIESRGIARVPISVLPIYVDSDHFKWALPDPSLEERVKDFSHRVLVVARLEREKNVEEAIRAFADSAPEGACLIIVGDGSQRDRLEDVARKLPSSSRIFFEGSRDPAACYRVADLLVVPSHYEGYGLVTAEALAAGVPVLSYDVGAARELGAIVVRRDELAVRLADWFQHGPREGHLLAREYRDLEEYVRLYCDDVRRVARR